METPIMADATAPAPHAAVKPMQGIRVIDVSSFLAGPFCSTQLAEFGRAKYALSCGNGTDALALPLMAWGIGAGDAVFCPSFTFAATGEVIPWLGHRRLRLVFG